MRKLTVLLALSLLALPAAAQSPVAPRSTVPGAHAQANDRAHIEEQRAQQALQKGDYSSARQAAERAAELDPLSSELQLLLGACRLGDGMPREAYQAYARAGLLDPSSAFAYNRAGQILLQYLGRPAGAKAVFEQALRIDPRHAPAHFSSHYYHLLRGEFPQAQQALALASSTVSSDDEHFLYLGVQQALGLYTGDYVAALGGLEAHLAQVAGDGRALQARALAHRLLGWNAEAETDVRELISALRRPDPGLIVDLGLTLRAEGRRDSARSYFVEASYLDRDRLEAIYNLALEAAAADDTSAAWEFLKGMAARYPDGYEAPLLTGRLLSARGDTARSRLAFAAAYRLAPISQAASSAVGEPLLLADRWPADTLFAAAESALLGGDAGVAGHKGIEACNRAESRPLGLAFAALAKEMTPGSAGQRVAHLEAAREASAGADAAWRCYLETRLARAHAEIGNPEEAESLYHEVLSREGLSADSKLPALNAYMAWLLGQGRGGEAGLDFREFEGVTDARHWQLRAEWAAAAGDSAAASGFREKERAYQFLP